MFTFYDPICQSILNAYRPNRGATVRVQTVTIYKRQETDDDSIYDGLVI